MNLKIPFFCLILFIFCSLFNHAVPLDLVVMIDTSYSMEQYFDDVVRYILSDILTKNLQPGDTFHLIRFSDTPVFEIEQVISDHETSEAVVKKLHFIKGKLFFGKFTDILAALKYLVLYAEDLPERNHKKLLLLSDFINNPAKDSPYAGLPDEEFRKELAEQANIVMAKDGWSIHFIRFPESRDDTGTGIISGDDRTTGTSITQDKSGDNNGKDTGTDQDISGNKETGDDAVGDTGGDGNTSGGKGTSDGTGNENNNVIDVVSDTFGVKIPTYDENEKEKLSITSSGFPYLEFPGNIGKTGRVFSIPFIIHNYQNKEIVIKLKSLEYDGKNILNGKVDPRYVGPLRKKDFRVQVKLPPEIRKGPVILPINLTFDDEYRIAPRKGEIVLYYTGDFFVNLFRFTGEHLTIIFIILIIVAVALIIFIFIRMRVFEGVFSDLLSSSVDYKNAPAEDLTSGDGILIEMRVTFQNPHIGFRNIHKLESEKTLTVGGGFSSYMVFLIPVPQHIAEITNYEGTFVFTPVQMEFFPDLKGPIKNCLNKPIPIKSKHGYQTMITFMEYESPLAQINRILHSVQHEG